MARQRSDLRPVLAAGAVTLLALLLRFLALFPGLECHEEESVVRRADSAQETEPGDRRRISHTRRVREDGFDLPAHLIGSLERRRFRKLDVQVHVSLILYREKAGRQLHAQPARNNRDRDEERH